MQAGIEKLHIEGRIRITFDPLVDRLPVIGAIKVCSFHGRLAFNRARFLYVFVTVLLLEQQLCRVICTCVQHIRAGC